MLQCEYESEYPKQLEKLNTLELKRYSINQSTRAVFDNLCATAATTAAPQPDPSSAKRKFTSVVGRNSSRAWFMKRLNVGCFLYKVPSIATLTDGFFKRYREKIRNIKKVYYKKTLKST